MFLYKRWLAAISRTTWKPSKFSGCTEQLTLETSNLNFRPCRSVCSWQGRYLPTKFFEEPFPRSKKRFDTSLVAGAPYCRNVQGPMAPVVVCYHYPCIDGIFAAFAAHTSFMQKGISSRFVPLTVYKQHDISDLGLQGDETVYMLDYSGPDKFAVKLAAIAARVIVLDHHKTAAEQLSDTSGHPQNLEVLIDMNRSGATIALDYFKPSFPEELVKMFRYVEDGDLWRWQIPDSKAFYAGIKTLNLQCDANVNPDIFKTLQQLKPDEIVNKGRSVLGDVEALIKSAAQASYPMQLGGAAGASQGWGRCLSVEVERDMATHRSQLGNELAQRSQQLGMPPIGAVCYCEEGMEERGQIKVSLRSIGECDTTAVSQHFGGGGHKNASSFNVPLTDLHTWRC